jgi:hypothetical protein
VTSLSTTTAVCSTVVALATRTSHVPTAAPPSARSSMSWSVTAEALQRGPRTLPDAKESRMLMDSTGVFEVEEGPDWIYAGRRELWWECEDE